MNFWSQINNVHILFWDVYNFWNRDNIKILTSDSRSGSKITHIVDFVFNSECLFMVYQRCSFCSAVVPWLFRQSTSPKQRKNVAIVWFTDKMTAGRLKDASAHCVISLRHVFEDHMRTFYNKTSIVCQSLNTWLSLPIMNEGDVHNSM